MQSNRTTRNGPSWVAAYEADVVRLGSVGLAETILAELVEFICPVPNEFSSVTDAHRLRHRDLPEADDKALELEARQAELRETIEGKRCPGWVRERRDRIARELQARHRSPDHGTQPTEIVPSRPVTLRGQRSGNNRRAGVRIVQGRVVL